MRPIGITLIAILNWFRASMFALGGLALIGVGHLSARLVSAVATDSFFEKLISFLGKSLGIGALLIAAVFAAAGLGSWLLKNWGRSLTLGLVGVWLFSGLLGLLRPRTVPHCPDSHRRSNVGLPHATPGQKSVSSVVTGEWNALLEFPWNANVWVQCAHICSSR